MSKQALQKNELKIFGKWSTEEIDIGDLGLKSYIEISSTITPHSSGKHEHQRFMKAKVNVIERLTNNLMRYGKCGGKKVRAIGIIRSVLQIIHLRTGRNPIKVLIEAIESSAPCEETTRIVYGGVAYPVSVDISPQRRVDLALRFITDGARKSAFNNPKTVDECLADEIISASKRDPKSQAVSKRNEIERIALSSR